jgi:hypothetical protein
MQMKFKSTDYFNSLNSNNFINTNFLERKNFDMINTYQDSIKLNNLDINLTEDKDKEKDLIKLNTNSNNNLNGRGSLLVSENQDYAGNLRMISINKNKLLSNSPKIDKSTDIEKKKNLFSGKNK